MDELSTYLGEKNFDGFCSKHPAEKKDGVHISVTENAEQVFSDSLHRVIINITNSPVFHLPEFISKHKNSFGILGIFLIAGFFLNQKKITDMRSFGAPFSKSQDCMYWAGDHYVAVNCDEIIPGKDLVAHNEERAKVLRKITRTDTLNEENAPGKIWYSKNNGKIEFFTAPGRHPENGKTLKPVTKYILQKYILPQK